MFESLKIHKFKGIKDVEIKDFKKFNMFVGKNNSCKTTILEALFLLLGISNANLSVSVNIFRNYNLINETFWRLFFYKMNVGDDIKISGELVNPQEIRELLIKPYMEHVIAEQNEKKISGHYTGLEGRDKMPPVNISVSGYSGFERKIGGLIYEFFIKRKNKEKPLKYVSTIKMKGLVPELNLAPDYKEYLDGSFMCSSSIDLDIGSRFNKLSIEKKTDKVVKVLKKIEPDLSSLSLGIEGKVYCDVGFERLIPINAMGDGIYRILAIILAIYNSENGILLIDEVENGFHYSSQEMLWKVIYEAATEYNVQIFVATHSSECVKAFCSTYDENLLEKDQLRLFRVDKKNEVFKLTSYNQKELKSAIESGWEMR